MNSRRHDLSDRQIRSVIVHRLRENPFIDGSTLNVEVDHGIVQLAGIVASATAREIATDDAAAAPGVVDVRNDIEVDGSLMASMR